MIYSLWIYRLILKLKNYCGGISILLFLLNIFDFVEGSNISILNSQGYKFRFLRKKSVEPERNFCSENLENLLNYTFVKYKLSSELSSNYKPLNKNYSSSTTILLPQGNESVEQYLKLTPILAPIQRIKSNEKVILSPVTGCVNLASYNLQSISTMNNETERLSGVQIFIFNLDDNQDDKSTNIDLKILLYSTQEKALIQPIVIVLSSFLPRKFSLSAISFISHSQRPLHIILTDSKSEVEINDDQLLAKDLNKLFISTIDLDKDRYFIYSEKMDDLFFENVQKQLIKTSLFKYGFFFGSNANSLSPNREIQKLWLFNDEKWFSIHKPDIRVAMIYIANRSLNAIELMIGKPIKTENQFDSYRRNRKTNTCNSAKFLNEIVKTYIKVEYFIDSTRTCYYDVQSNLKPIAKKYKTITWLHIESLPNVSLNIEFKSSHNMDLNSNSYLVILTENPMTNSKIALSSVFHDKVNILTNISLDRFDLNVSGNSSSIKLQLINNSNDGSFQSQTIANYISAGSSATMQTTVYSFVKTRPFYEISINIDDSKSVPEVIHNCTGNSHDGYSILISINLSKWKLIGNWAEAEFYLGNSSCIFKKRRNKTIHITKEAIHCSSTYNDKLYYNKIYGIWRNKTYLLKTVYFLCKNNANQKSHVTSTKESAIYIPKDENVINIFNNSDRKTFQEKIFYDKSRIFIQLVNLKPPFSFELRSCYLTNQMATPEDFKLSTEIDGSFKKMSIVNEGCLNKSSPWYLNIDKSQRPNELPNYNTEMSYYFFIEIDADIWANKLNLENQWYAENKYEVHLYCNISPCFKKNSKFTSSCRSKEERCSKKLSNIDIEVKYYGSFVIAKKYENVFFKIGVLITLLVIIFLILLSFILFCLCYSFKKRHIQLEIVNKNPRLEVFDQDVLFSSPRKRLMNLNYHSLTLLSNPNDKYATKLYSEPKLYNSLKNLVANCDKSIYLNAGYLTFSPNADNSQLSVSVVKPLYSPNKFKNKCHSLSEHSFTEPTMTNFVINSWPLSSVERKYKSQGRNNSHQYNIQLSKSMKMKSNQPSNNSRHPTTNSSGGSSKHKVSSPFHSELKFNSNLKISSNRTTVSDSTSVNDMPNKSSSKWWSLLTNYWMNQSLVMSRN